MIAPGMEMGWWQRQIAAELMRFWTEWQSGNRPKLLIMAPPQHGKSRQVVEFISWVAGQSPDIKAIYASFSDDLGTRANRDLQRIYDLERYHATFPGTQINSRNVVTLSSQTPRNSTLLSYVGREGFFRNTTVQGQITGQAMDLGVIDDPIKGRAEANSITTRNKAWDWLNDDFFTRLSKKAAVLGIMTRWHQDDPFGRLIERDPSIRVLRYPAVAESDEGHRLEGEALFPEHKPLDFLMERKATMANASWEALYQQNPIPREGSMFQRDWFNVTPAAPAGCRWVRGWDLAGSEGRDSAYTAGILMGRSQDGRYFIADATRAQVTGAGVERLIANTAGQDAAEYPGVRGSIPQDPGSAGKSWAQHLIKQIAPHNYRASTETGDKATRAEGLSAQAEGGNVYLVSGDWNKAFLDEITTFPVGKWKDQVDAASRAFSELLDTSTYALEGAI
jgi:predicted phage terminase large subunit-like protein